MASSLTRFLDHKQRRTTVGRTPPDEWSARRWDLYLTTHNTHNRQTSKTPVGFEPTNLSRRAAADLRLRPRGHWDRRKSRLGMHIQVCFSAAGIWYNILHRKFCKYVSIFWKRLFHTEGDFWRSIHCTGSFKLSVRLFQRNGICLIS